MSRSFRLVPLAIRIRSKACSRVISSWVISTPDRRAYVAVGLQRAVTPSARAALLGRGDRERAVRGDQPEEDSSTSSNASGLVA